MSSVEICGLLFVLKYNTSDSSILLSLIINFILLTLEKGKYIVIFIITICCPMVLLLAYRKRFNLYCLSKKTIIILLIIGIIINNLIKLDIIYGVVSFLKKSL